MKLLNYGFKLTRNTIQIPFNLKAFFETNIKPIFVNKKSPLPTKEIIETRCPPTIDLILENAIPEEKVKTNDAVVFLKNNASLFNKAKLQTNRKTEKNDYEPKRRPRTPDLIYIPQVMRWLKTKIQFKYLKATWDPEFSEGAFIYGTTNALSKITKIIHKDKPQELEGLLTAMGLIRLQKDMKVKLSKLQKLIIEIKPEDIKILVPLNVEMKMHGKYKECAVLLRSLALKWFEDRDSLKLVLVALQTEFVRDYSEGNDPEWTINRFEVLECAMLNEPPKTKP